MSPKKRVSGANASDAKRAKSQAPADGGLEQAAQEAVTSAGNLPWWTAAMEQLNNILEEGVGASEWLLEQFPTQEKREAFATELWKSFPCPEGVTLSKDLSPGVKTFQLWQVCYHVQAGNKGMVPNEYFKPLVQLILLEGCKTDASTIPGVEYPVITDLVPAFFKEPWKTGSLVGETYDYQSIAFIKGWTRCLGMVLAAKILIDLGAVDYYKQHMPEQFKSFCVLKGMAPQRAGTAAEQISANRGDSAVLQDKLPGKYFHDSVLLPRTHKSNPSCL